MPTIDILLPTCNRLSSFIMTLAGVAGQAQPGLHLIVADQSEHPVREDSVAQSLARIIEARGNSIEWHRRIPSQGIAEQRDFLLRQSQSPAVLYLDDDVFMEPWVAGSLLSVLELQQCGFVGAFPNGLSFRDDVRPAQQTVEFWDGPVEPEAVTPGSREWNRNVLHRAANLYHATLKSGMALHRGTIRTPEVRLYKVAWVASCILYSREKLLQVGGFSFWQRLPRFHSGEEVLVQNLLMRRWGGCAIMPSGTYHSELPSTVLNEEGTVDGHALDLLDEMVARYAPPHAASEARPPSRAPARREEHERTAS